MLGSLFTIIIINIKQFIVFAYYFLFKKLSLEIKSPVQLALIILIWFRVIVGW